MILAFNKRGCRFIIFIHGAPSTHSSYTHEAKNHTESSMSTGGPRLGKLKGLKREDEEDEAQAMQRRASKKGGIKVRKNIHTASLYLLHDEKTLIHSPVSDTPLRGFIDPSLSAGQRGYNL